MATDKSLGILMTDSSFERLPGDIGNPATWQFPVIYKTLSGITPAQMMTLPDVNPLDIVLQAADDLIENGVYGITTTCGFLGLYQKELSAHCRVPVATSSLLQVPMVKRLIPPEKEVIILTYDAEALTPTHLEAVGVSVDTPIVGIPHESLFYQWIMNGLEDIDVTALDSEIATTAKQILKSYPKAGAIVAECTNLTPFSTTIAESTRLPVFDTVSMLRWFHSALQPTVFINPQ